MWLGNAAGWNTAKPDKVWNYCAMHHMCDSNAAWAPHCSSCFRCKLGGTEQSNLIVQRSAVQPGATMDPADFYETAKRVPPTQIDQGKVHDESVQILNKFGVDATNVSSTDTSPHACLVPMHTWYASRSVVGTPPTVFWAMPRILPSENLIERFPLLLVGRFRQQACPSGGARSEMKALVQICGDRGAVYLSGILAG